jgi:hypothetical protein
MVAVEGERIGKTGCFQAKSPALWERKTILEKVLYLVAWRFLYVVCHNHGRPVRCDVPDHWQFRFQRVARSQAAYA